MVLRITQVGIWHSLLFFAIYRMVLQITTWVICRTILHTTSANKKRQRDGQMITYRMPSWTTRLMHPVVHGHTRLHSKSRGGSVKLKSLVKRMSFTYATRKKRSERSKHCTLAAVRQRKFFFAPQTPFPGVRDGQNSISWRWSLPLPTNPVWWGSIHAISSYRGNRLTHPHRQDRLQYTAPQLASMQCKYLLLLLLCRQAHISSLFPLPNWPVLNLHCTVFLVMLTDVQCSWSFST